MMIKKNNGEIRAQETMLLSEKPVQTAMAGRMLVLVLMNSAMRLTSSNLWPCTLLTVGATCSAASCASSAFQMR